MNESKYPIKGMKDRAASASGWICPDCGSPLVEVDGSLMHSAGAGKPARGCSCEECSYVGMI